MALPVTISDAKPGTRNSYHGPFKSSGGAFYTILVDAGTGDDEIEAFKATDPTSSFSEQDDANVPQMTTGGLDTVISLNIFQSSDNLHCASQSDANDVFYARFDMANDLWVNIDGAGDRDILIDDAPNGTADACDIAVLSASYGVGSAFVKIRVVYQGATNMDMGSDFETIDESNSVDDGVTWAAPTSVDNSASVAGLHYTGPRIVVGDSDTSHVLYIENYLGAAPVLRQHAIAGDDTLQTDRVTSVAAPNAGTLYSIGHGISFDRSGTTKIRVPYIKSVGDFGQVIEFDAASDPSTFTDSAISVDIAVNNSSVGMCIAADGSVIRGLLIKDINDDLFEFFDDDADSYTLEGTAHRIGTVNHISCNVYDRSGLKLAMIYDDGGTVKYDEIDLGGGGVTTMVAAQGGYILTGKDATTIKDTPITAVQGAYILTGKSAILSQTKSILADQGNYVLTGTAVNTLWDHRLLAAQGSYTLTGKDANTLFGFSILATQGAYILSGQTANLLLGHTISVAQGSYILSGQASNLLIGHLINAIQGSYNLTGIAATTSKNIPMVAVQGVYNLNGQAANLLRNHVVIGAQGDYNLTGQAAVTSAGLRLLTTQGSYTVTGQAANLLWDHLIIVSQGSYTLSGQAAIIARQITITGAQGNYNLTGQASNLLWDHLILASQGNYNLTGQAANLLWDHLVSLGQGSYNLTGQAANLFVTSLVTLLAAQGNYNLTGQAAILTFLGVSITTGNIIFGQAYNMLHPEEEDALRPTSTSELIIRKRDKRPIVFGGDH